MIRQRDGVARRFEFGISFIHYDELGERTAVEWPMPRLRDVAQGIAAFESLIQIPLASGLVLRLNVVLFHTAIISGALILTGSAPPFFSAQVNMDWFQVIPISGTLSR